MPIEFSGIMHYKYSNGPVKNFSFNVRLGFSVLVLGVVDLEFGVRVLKFGFGVWGVGLVFFLDSSALACSGCRV